MWVELLIGATLLVVVLTIQREHMATGVYTKDLHPTDAESSEIFDQVMAMAPSVLHDAHADTLVLAKSALVDAKRFAAQLPDDQLLKAATTTSEEKLVQYVKHAVAYSVIIVKHIVEQEGSQVTEETIKTHVEKIYTKLNEHIDDALPPIVPIPNETPIQTEMNAKFREYLEQARTLVKKYDTIEVRDACVLVLKEYYIDQLKPGWNAPTTVIASDPTAAGNMTDLEAEYQQRKTVYDNLVASALATNDASKVDAIAAAKQAMNETLSKMMALSVKSGTESQQADLIRRIMEIQRDYNGLLVSTDKLATLRHIHQFQDERQGVELKVYGLAFLFATLGLFVLVMRTS
jgi:hypothetical protein